MNTNFEVKGSLNVKTKMLDPLVINYNGDLVVLRYENSNAVFDIKTSDGIDSTEVIPLDVIQQSIKGYIDTSAMEESDLTEMEVTFLIKDDRIYGKYTYVKNDDVVLTITMQNGEMTCTDNDGTNTVPLDTDSVKRSILSPFKDHTLVDIIRSEAEKYKAVMQ